MRHFVVLIPLLLPVSAVVAQEPKGASVAVDFGASTSEAGTESETAGKSQLIKVVATGVGTDPEKALQNAFTHAIEQAVGVLVDAETIIENDQIVRDRVLTFSRGFLKKHDVIARWQEDSLHHARIWALVSVSELSEKLTAEDLAVREVPGELLWGQAVTELISEQNAAEMVRRVMRDCTLDKLLKVTIEGKPQVVERDAIQAQLQVKINLSADMEAWKRFHGSLNPLLERTHIAKAVLSATPQTAHDKGWYHLEFSREERDKKRTKLKSSEERKAVRVLLLREATPTGNCTYWDAYLVPAAIIAEAAGAAAQRQYQLCIRVLDADDNLITRIERPVGGLFQRVLVGDAYYDSRFTYRKARFMTSSRGSYSFGPLFLTENPDYNVGDGGAYSFSYPIEETISVELDKLRRVAKVVASVEEVSAD